MTLRSSATTSRRKRTSRLGSEARTGRASRTAVARPLPTPVPASGAGRRPRRSAAVLGRSRPLPPSSRSSVTTSTLQLAGGPAGRRPLSYVLHGLQGRQDLNLQPAVLETAALPIELHP